MCSVHFDSFWASKVVLPGVLCSVIRNFKSKCAQAISEDDFRVAWAFFKPEKGEQ